MDKICVWFLLIYFTKSSFVKYCFLSKCCTVCPGSSDPFYIVTYCIIWVTTPWTYSIANCDLHDWTNCTGFKENPLLPP